LTRDGEQLAAIRQKLKQNLSSAALFDTDGLRRGIEEVLVRMHNQAPSAH
jgi:hypothetical protein